MDCMSGEQRGSQESRSTGCGRPSLPGTNLWDSRGSNFKQHIINVLNAWVNSLSLAPVMASGSLSLTPQNPEEVTPAFIVSLVRNQFSF